MELDRPNKLFRQRARELRNNSTLSEVLLWNQLKNGQFMGLDFDRQKVINNRYIADLYCPTYNLIIEIDGCSHEEKGEYDLERHNYLISLGFKILHVQDTDIKKNMEAVLTLIAKSISEKSPLLSEGVAGAKKRLTG